jgi:hypothetical protein
MRLLSTIRLVAPSSAMRFLCTGDTGNGVPALICSPDVAMTSPPSEVRTTMPAPMRPPLFSSTDTSVSVWRVETASRNP